MMSRVHRYCTIPRQSVAPQRPPCPGMGSPYAVTRPSRDQFFTSLVYRAPALVLSLSFQWKVKSAKIARESAVLCDIWVCDRIPSPAVLIHPISGIEPAPAVTTGVPVGGTVILPGGANPGQMPWEGPGGPPGKNGAVGPVWYGKPTVAGVSGKVAAD